MHSVRSYYEAVVWAAVPVSYYEAVPVSYYEAVVWAAVPVGMQ